jgi:hypothetical protein
MPQIFRGLRMTSAHYSALSRAQTEQDIAAHLAPTVTLTGAELNDAVPEWIKGSEFFVPSQEITPGIPFRLARNPVPAVPVNDNEPPAPDPAEALHLCMRRLAASTMPIWARSVAQHWLRMMNRPGATEAGFGFLKIIAQQKPALLARIDPNGVLRDCLLPAQPKPRPNSNARAQLKLEHAPPTVSTAFIAEQIKHVMEQKLHELTPPPFEPNPRAGSSSRATLKALEADPAPLPLPATEQKEPEPSLWLRLATHALLALAA